MSGLGASYFSPLLRVAKVEIPKSIPVELLDLGRYSAQVSTTKLAKYRPALSLIIGTDVGSLGNFRLPNYLNFSYFS